MLKIYQMFKKKGEGVKGVLDNLKKAASVRKIGGLQYMEPGSNILEPPKFCFQYSGKESREKV